MSDLQIAQLSPEQVTQAWAELSTLFSSALERNGFAAGLFTADDVYVMTQIGTAVVFTCTEAGVIRLAIAVQFAMENGIKCAEVLILAGRGLMRAKAAYWESIREWLRANEVRYVTAYTQPQLAKILQRKFGFDLSCVCSKMML